ncbi:hypothetical protein [uncultured Salinisphaera sp.]|uniref:hypothetical protein n=1 Tax=uncultured Salinisphaera sp. TaxID=359372 RepID=UPI0032B14B06|tara:strand:+ start:3289 stop:3639 length:351 start_codon:yes stop_codon:yes gene_type:complete
MVVRLFIVFIVVWQAVVAPVAMGAMFHEPSTSVSVSQTGQTGQTATVDDHAVAGAHHESAKPCCSMAGHCTPAGLLLTGIALVPAPSVDNVDTYPYFLRPSGFPTAPYRPPSARLS